ncbi:hypothetical protein F0562_005237 [Nyssa sinensis]|uniref:Uncharacterized protein n=1 Tax=Nyssa sinensis TaxID=561372 RepID=A0A5J5AJZ9_9ASTE|nr:hypothetical protein F0562_005237 [Nyssa sinensis]
MTIQAEVRRPKTLRGFLFLFLRFSYGDVGFGEADDECKVKTEAKFGMDTLLNASKLHKHLPIHRYKQYSHPILTPPPTLGKHPSPLVAAVVDVHPVVVEPIVTQVEVLFQVAFTSSMIK